MPAYWIQAVTLCFSVISHGLDVNLIAQKDNPNIYPTGINLDGKLISFIVLFGELILFFSSSFFLILITQQLWCPNNQHVFLIKTFYLPSLIS